MKSTLNWGNVKQVLPMHVSLWLPEYSYLPRSVNLHEDLLSYLLAEQGTQQAFLVIKLPLLFTKHQELIKPTLG